MKLQNLIHHSRKSSQSTSRSLISKIGRDPYVDWLLTFIVAFIITAVLISLGVIAYFDVDNRLTTPSSRTTVPAVALDIKVLGRVMNEFENREAVRSSALRGYAGPGDPSIGH